MRYVLGLVMICVLAGTPKSQGLKVIDNCLKTLDDVPGCLKEVLSSFLTIRTKIGPQCCNALLHIEDKCWRQTFPYAAPSYPLLLRALCKSPPPPPHQKYSLYARNLASPPAPARKDA